VEVAMNKQFTVLDGNGKSTPVSGYQQASQLAAKYAESGHVAVIVIRVMKECNN
jgi:hypothetical protein